MKKTLITALFLCINYFAIAQVEFFTNFSSGAIGSVELLEQKMYTSQTDMYEELEYKINTKIDPANPANPKLEPSRRWFYFLMTGVKDKSIVLDIFYNDSRRPVYSYDNVNFIRFSETEAPEHNKRITKKYERDSVWVAYFVPYNNDHLDGKFNEWTNLPNTKEFSIGQSEYNRDMRMLVITNNIHNGLIPSNGVLNYNKEDKKKKVIYIHGRVHPSETPSSWQLEGIIDFLTSNNQYANDLRENAIFYILPFTNPDGVEDGMSRSNSNGINLEVNWDNQEEVTAKEVKNIRSFLYNLKNSGIIPTMFLNMHSQIAPHVTYWIHDAESTSDKYYNDLMLLANLTMQDNPYFSKDELSFSKIAPRYLEGWMYDKFNKQTLSTTFETPYSFYHKDENGVWVTPENMKEQGINTVNAVGDLLGLGINDRVVMDEPKRASKHITKRDNNNFYFGNSYLEAKKDGAKLRYKGNLNLGDYDVYKWSVGANEKASKDGYNEWVKIGSFNNSKSGRVKYTIYNNKGDKLDRIIFVKKNSKLIDRDKIYVQ